MGKDNGIVSRSEPDPIQSKDGDEKRIFWVRMLRHKRNRNNSKEGKVISQLENLFVHRSPMTTKRSPCSRRQHGQLALVQHSRRRAAILQRIQPTNITNYHRVQRRRPDVRVDRDATSNDEDKRKCAHRAIELWLIWPVDL